MGGRFNPDSMYKWMGLTEQISYEADATPHVRDRSQDHMTRCTHPRKPCERELPHVCVRVASGVTVSVVDPKNTLERVKNYNIPLEKQATNTSRRLGECEPGRKDRNA